EETAWLPSPPAPFLPCCRDDRGSARDGRPCPQAEERPQAGAPAHGLAHGSDGNFDAQRDRADAQLVAFLEDVPSRFASRLEEVGEIALADVFAVDEGSVAAAKVAHLQGRRI